MIDKAIKKITYWPPGTSTKQMLEKTNVTKIYDRAINLSIKYLKSSLHNNPLLNTLLRDYLINLQVNEGAIIKKMTKANKTVLGTLLDNNL